MPLRKICFVTTVHPANDTRVYYKELLTLSNAGFDITYIAPNIELINEESVKKINCIKPNSRIKRFTSLFSVWRLAIKQGCDVYHLQDPELIVVYC